METPSILIGPHPKMFEFFFRFMAVGCLEPKFHAAFLDTLGLETEKHGQFDKDCYDAQRAEIELTFKQKTQVKLFADRGLL